MDGNTFGCASRLATPWVVKLVGGVDVTGGIHCNPVPSADAGSTVVLP